MNNDMNFEYDEDMYLLLNPDVALAVRNKQFESGLAHFNQFGKLEGRAFASRKSLNQKGKKWAEDYQELSGDDYSASEEPCRLEKFFLKNISGPGIWKWRHYFKVYERYLSKFVGKEVHFLEIGVYSGRSLRMWREYFGPLAYIYGVDIMPECRAYEDERTKIYIGDQADPEFWMGLRKEVPTLNAVVDDGGHGFIQQVVTLNMVLPHLQSGGVFICEDVQGSSNQFTEYNAAMANVLNASETQISNESNNDERLVVSTNAFQKYIESINFYPFLTVIEKKIQIEKKLIASKKGTDWQPFLT